MRKNWANFKLQPFLFVAAPTREGPSSQGAQPEPEVEEPEAPEAVAGAAQIKAGKATGTFEKAPPAAAANFFFKKTKMNPGYKKKHFLLVREKEEEEEEEILLEKNDGDLGIDLIPSKQRMNRIEDQRSTNHDSWRSCRYTSCCNTILKNLVPKVLRKETFFPFLTAAAAHIHTVKSS